MKDISKVVRDAMAECGNDRNKAITTLLNRDNDLKVNEAFRVLGIKQAVRSFQTEQRSGHTPGTSSERFVSGRVTGAVVRAASAAPRRATTDTAQIETARKAIKDVMTQFMEMHTLFGGKVSLKDATRPDFKRSAENYGTQEAGAKRMRQFHSACAEELPIGSVAATLPVSKYPRIFKLAKEYGVIDSERDAA